MFFTKKYTLSQVVDFIIKGTHVKDYYNLVVIRTSDNTTFVISNKEPIGQDGAYGILMGGFDTYIDIFNGGFNSDLRSISGVNLKHHTNETDLLKAIYQIDKLLEYEGKFHSPNVWTERKSTLGYLLAEKMSNNSNSIRNDGVTDGIIDDSLNNHEFTPGSWHTANSDVPKSGKITITTDLALTYTKDKDVRALVDLLSNTSSNLIVRFDNNDFNVLIVKNQDNQFDTTIINQGNETDQCIKGELNLLPARIWLSGYGCGHHALNAILERTKVARDSITGFIVN